MAARIRRSAAAGAAIAWACLGPCQANPIRADDAAAQLDAAPAAAGRTTAVPSPGASMPLMDTTRGDRGRSQSADADAKTLAQERADDMASARDPALLPIDMQGVGAQAHPAPSALPKTPAAEPVAENDSLKRYAASARGWMHDVFGGPDNVQDNNPSSDAFSSPHGVGGELGLPVETQSSGVPPLAQRPERPVEVPPPGAASHRAAAAAPVQPTAGARLLTDSAPEYAIQRVLARCREVLVHPLTWLAVVLIAITHIVMSRGKR